MIMVKYKTQSVKRHNVRYEPFTTPTAKKLKYVHIKASINETARTESNLSRNPPCPGKIFPKSLMP